MKNALFFILFTTSLFSSCAVIKQESMVGKFEGVTTRTNSFVPASEKNLSLNSDGTFTLYWARTDYTGKWSLYDKKNILLEFNRMADPFFYLQSGVISAEKKMVKIINLNKLKDDINTILMRVE